MYLSRINTTLIKGTSLEEVNQVRLDTDGVRQNRLFYFIDDEGKMVNGKRLGELVRIQSSYHDETKQLAIQLPTDKIINAQVRLTKKIVLTDFYGRPVKGWIVDGPWAEAISKFFGCSLRLVQVAPRVTAADVHPVTLISTATMDAIRGPTSESDAQWRNRFRMLFEIEGLKPYEEDSWENKLLYIDEAVVRVVGPVPRCIVTTQNSVTGIRNFETLKAIRLARGEHRRYLSSPTAHLPDGGKLLLGMYAVIERSGVVRRNCQVYIF